MFLLSRTSGPSPHTAKIIIPTAEANLTTTGFPCKRLNDLQGTKFLHEKNDTKKFSQELYHTKSMQSYMVQIRSIFHVHSQPTDALKGIKTSSLSFPELTFLEILFSVEAAKQ